MTTNDYKAKTGRAVPTAAERRVAARIRVSADKKLGRTTPAWIKDLASPKHNVKVKHA